MPDSRAHQRRFHSPREVSRGRVRKKRSGAHGSGGGVDGSGGQSVECQAENNNAYRDMQVGIVANRQWNRWLSATVTPSRQKSQLKPGEV